MKNERNFTIDFFRMILAIFIVALHSSPFSEYNVFLSYIPTQVISRIGVPFFAAVAGYYFFLDYDSSKYLRTFKRYFYTYLIWSLMMFVYSIIYNGMWKSVGEMIKYLVQTFCLKGWYHLWYMLAIMYTIGLLWLFSHFRQGFNVLYKISFCGLLLGILMFGYGNLFSNIPIFKNILGIFNVDVNMPEQWLFIVVPFFMMGWKLSQKNLKEWVYKRVEILLFLSILGYLMEIILITVTNVKGSTTVCIFTYPIVYLLLLLAFKYPHIGNEKISHYCAGISSFMYFAHIMIVITLQNIGISSTPTFWVTVLMTIMLGGIIIKLDNPILKILI